MSVLSVAKLFPPTSTGGLGTALSTTDDVGRWTSQPRVGCGREGSITIVPVLRGEARLWNGGAPGFAGSWSELGFLLFAMRRR